MKTRREGEAMSGTTPAVEPQPPAFTVELPVFTGPFRVLADLILEQTIDVCDVPVAAVTDAFLAHAKDVERWDLEEATWFLAICAILLELKVGRLTPKHTELDEDDLLGGNPDLVYARSLELSAFRRVAGELARRATREADYHTRDVGPGEGFAHLYPDVMERVTPEQLQRLAAALLKPPPVLDLSHVTPIRFTVSDAIADVERSLSLVREAPFRELVADCAERIQVVVRFLALLELYRDGKIEVEQAETFGELRVRWSG
jgi:segregation and condensation protein A